MKTYNGIELNHADKTTRMSHSIIEGNIGVESLQELFNIDKKTLTIEQFQTMSALSSVINMNAQICNGGLLQYYDNGYDKSRDPFNEQDVANLDKSEQVAMLYVLHNFAAEVFPERRKENIALKAIIIDFANSYYEEIDDCWEEDEEDWIDGEKWVVAPYTFDSDYYKINDYLENIMELYAQYLLKKWGRAAAA